MAEYMKYGQVDYGRTGYATDTQDSGQERIEIDLMRYLPEYWQEEQTMKELQKAFGTELEKLLLYFSDVKKQMFIESATWGLTNWEKAFGLDTDVSKSYEFRRERIRAKIRGTGVATKQMIVNVASAFAGGEAEVIEYPAESRFVVKFVGVKGVPANMTDLTQTIEEIRPAHLAFEFEYTYVYWDELRQYTWGELRSYTWDQVRDGAMKKKKILEVT